MRKQFNCPLGSIQSSPREGFAYFSFSSRYPSKNSLTCFLNPLMLMFIPPFNLKMFIVHMKVNDPAVLFQRERKRKDEMIIKKLFLIQAEISFNKVTLIFEIWVGRFVYVVCASAQVKPKQQNHYPIKEFLPIHSRPLSTSFFITAGFPRFKVTQSSMEGSWLNMT